MKVYVIERGWYSDKYIAGVVETEAEAKQICDVINSGDTEYHNDARYEEFDTEQFVTRKIRWIVEEDYLNEWSAYSEDDYFRDEATESYESYEDHYIVYADSKEDAIKIAQDLKAEKLAEKSGVKL